MCGRAGASHWLFNVHSCRIVRNPHGGLNLIAGIAGSSRATRTTGHRRRVAAAHWADRSARHIPRGRARCERGKILNGNLSTDPGTLRFKVGFLSTSQGENHDENQNNQRYRDIVCRHRNSGAGARGYTGAGKPVWFGAATGPDLLPDLRSVGRTGLWNSANQ